MMDRSVNLPSDLHEIVIETKLESRNIKPVFEVVLSNSILSKWSSFLYLEQNTLNCCTLSNLSKKMVEKVIQFGTKITKKSHELLVNTYSEQRHIFIFVSSGDTVLITESEVISLLLNKTKRHLAEGRQLKRRIDADFLIAMFVNNKDHDKKDDIGDDFDKLQSDNASLEIKKKMQMSIKKISIENTRKDTHDSSKVTLIGPRRPHTATFVEHDKSDIFNDDLILCTFPKDKEIYDKVSFSHYQRRTSDEENFPTQVTEVDAGLPSFVSQHEHTPISFVTRNFQPGRTGFSSPGEGSSFIQQAAIRGSLVTSGSGHSFHSKPSRYPEYRDQKKRHESFYTPKWHTDSKPDIKLLVECGFFFPGNHDLVRCYHCGIGLKDWIKEDDVVTEHVKYSSTCDFLIWKYGKNQIDRMKATLTPEGNNEAGSSPPPLQYPIRSPRYQTMEARVASFELFPNNINIPHQQLAVAGLFCTGQGDLCRCFTCDGGLKDWNSGDDPIKEHATYFPNCPYINKLKGTQYVQLQQQIRTGSESMRAGATGSNNVPTQPTESSSNLQIDRLTLQDSDYSSFNVSQVVQNLGYSELDVITAKSELEQRGKPYPSVEEVVNTLLDIKERAKQIQAGATDQGFETGL